MPFTYRKRKAGGGYGVARTAPVYPRVVKRRRTAAPYVVPGYTRQAGFYGRFAGPKAELKFHDLDIDDGTVSASGAIAEDSCNVIAQGNTESQRVGRKLTIRKINWKYEVRLASVQDQANPPNGDLVRIILYQDKQTNGATAAITDILETADYQSFRNLANLGRFNILMDRTHRVGESMAQTDGTNTAAYPIVHSGPYGLYKACNIPIEYDNSATTGVITSQRSNNIGVLTISQAGVAGFFSKMRLRYSDV